MSWLIPLADIDFSEEESLAVEQVLQSRWLTMGSVTQEFEDEFKVFSNVKHALAVTNCTAALHLAYLSLGLGPGDEVILPSLTFVATANAVRYTGATPVFADIVGDNDLTIDLNSIRKLVNPHTKAIAVMHYGGYACAMPDILAFSHDHHLAVVEDAAHSAGSYLGGVMLGTLGDVGCYSFFSNKNMTTGEGGMLVTNDEKIFEIAKRLRSHGMTSLTWDRHQGHAWSYDVTDLGYNYRIDEIRAAIGLAQLKKVTQFNQKRYELTMLYRRLLADRCPKITIPFINHPGKSACHIMPIILPASTKRTEFMEKMKVAGIQTSIHYPPIHQFSYYQKGQTGNSPNLELTEDLAAREVTLPLYPGLKNEQVDYIVHQVALIMEK